MENGIQIFDNKEFGQVRTVMENGKPLFCGSDVARALGYARPNDAVSTHTRGAVKRRTLTNGGEQEMTFIPEGDVYRLITHSKLPSAERFERWVFDEVLPSLRKNGAYMTTATLEKVMNDPDAWITLLTTLKNERQQRRELEEQAEKNKPKVLFADAVATAETTILVGELAKLLKGNGIDIGQNRLYEQLRRGGYLISRPGSDYNTPTQKAMELGLFKVKETVIAHSDGHVTVNKTSKVTGKGQQYFINKYLKYKEDTENAENLKN